MLERSFFSPLILYLGLFTFARLTVTVPAVNKATIQKKYRALVLWFYTMRDCDLWPELLWDERLSPMVLPLNSTFYLIIPLHHYVRAESENICLTRWVHEKEIHSLSSLWCLTVETCLPPFQTDGRFLLEKKRVAFTVNHLCRNNHQKSCVTESFNSINKRTTLTDFAWTITPRSHNNSLCSSEDAWDSYNVNNK